MSTATLGMDYYARIKGPEDTSVDETDPARLLDSGTATYKSYDPGVDGVVLVAASAGAVQLQVSDISLWNASDRFEVTNDDGTFYTATIDSIVLSTGIINFTLVTPKDIDAGARIRKMFSPAAVTMTLYGTPKVGSLEWGYRGVLADTDPHQIVDQAVRVEMELDAGPGIKLRKVECFTVVDDCGV